jgi:hypothetical protein
MNLYTQRMDQYISMKLVTLLEKKERNLLEGRTQGQSQMSRSKTRNFNKQRNV